MEPTDGRFDLSVLVQDLEPVMVRRPLPVWVKALPASLRKPEWEYVERSVRPMDAAAYQLYKESVERPEDGEVTERLIRRLVPDLTDDEYALLTPAQMGFIILHAMGNLKQVIEYVGNVDERLSAGPMEPLQPKPDPNPQTA